VPQGSRRELDTALAHIDQEDCPICHAYVVGLARGVSGERTNAEAREVAKGQAEANERKPLQRIAALAKRYGGSIGPRLASDDATRHYLRMNAPTSPIRNKW
jgi:hypothetical protein